ncbi:MAG: ABC transporter permease [Ardenticatenaceae bacterium]|nr:ABC transporter permease [Ardenticatenaceae bacterium]
MNRYVIRKFLLLIPTAFVVVTVVFWTMHLAPGDPAVAILGDDADSETLEAFRARYDLNRSLMVQYASYLRGLAKGDLGVSYENNRSVLSSYFEMLPYTIDLIVVATVFSVLIGIPLGTISALRYNSLVDYTTTIFSSMLIAFPIFFLGILLLLVFAAHLNIFPVLGGGDLSHLGSRVRHLILPALSLGLVEGARVLRVTRTSMLNVLSEAYITTARAKGLSSRRINYVHALRNALIPITTLVGIHITVLLAGSILTETVFNRPGIGRLLVGAIHARDYPMVQSGLLIYAILVVLVNLLVDLAVGFIDPRVRYE